MGTRNPSTGSHCVQREYDVDLFDVTRACFRRWYILLPLLLVTTWFSYDAYSSAKPVYYANTVIGFSPPSVRMDTPGPLSNEVRRNGLLDIGGAALVANLTALGLKDPAVVGRIIAAGGLPDYSAKVFPIVPPNPQLPLVMVEASSPDPATVPKTLELVTAQTEVTLRTLQQQANVPDDQMVSSFVVSPPGDPIGAMPTRTRSTMALFVAGAGLSVLVTVVADVLLSRRRRTQARPPDANMVDSAAVRPGGPQLSSQGSNGNTRATSSSTDTS